MFLTFTGHLRAQGITLGERTVRKYLRRLTPNYTAARRHGVERQTNPVKYSAAYPGHKLHIDQNEKLVEYGVCHVIAVDGYSAKIMAYHTMPIKNNVSIYDNIYKKTVEQVELFDQIRVDCGREFYLIL